MAACDLAFLSRLSSSPNSPVLGLLGGEQSPVGQERVGRVLLGPVPSPKFAPAAGALVASRSPKLPPAS